MKRKLLFLIFTGYFNFLFGQTDIDSVYQTEVKRIQKLVELNLLKNSDLFCEDFIGSTIWIIITKDSKDTSKVRVIALDQWVRKKFETLKDRNIEVKWKSIDKDFNSLVIIQPVAITCLGQERIDNSSWFAFNSMFDVLVGYKNSKMIIFNTLTFDIGVRRTKTNN